MLKLMRKHATSWIIKVFFAIIIIVFVFYFGYGRLASDENVIAEVGSYKVSRFEYEDARKKSYDLYKMIYQDKLNDKLLKELNFEEKLMNDMIDSYLLLIAADKIGFKVSDKEFTETVSSIQAFQKNGKFDKDRYLAALRKINKTPDEFEESTKRGILRQKVMALVTDTGAFINESDVWAGYVKEKGRINLSYAVFDPQGYKGKAAVSEKELNDTYEREKGLYRTEDVYTLKELVINEKSSLRDDTVYMDLLTAKDIDAYAKEKGLAVINVGPEKESGIVERFKGLNVIDRLKGLKKGEFTVPVRETGKSHIFQLIDIEVGKNYSKDVAFAKIKEKLLTEKAGVLAKEAAEAAIKAKAIHADHQTGFIARNSSSLPGIGDIPAGNKALLTLSTSESLYGKPVEIGGTYYVFTFKEESRPAKDEWEKEKESYGKYFAAKKREELLRSFLTRIRSQVKIKLNKKFS